MQRRGSWVNDAPCSEKKEKDGAGCTGKEWFDYMTVLSHPYDPLLLFAMMEPHLFQPQYITCHNHPNNPNNANNPNKHKNTEPRLSAPTVRSTSSHSTNSKQSQNIDIMHVTSELEEELKIDFKHFSRVPPRDAHVKDRGDVRQTHVIHSRGRHEHVLIGNSAGETGIRAEDVQAVHDGLVHAIARGLECLRGQSHTPPI